LTIFCVNFVHCMESSTNGTVSFPKMETSGFAKVRYTVDTTKNTKDGFSIATARFGVRGDIAKDASYCFSIEGTNTDTGNINMLYDVYIDVRTIPYFTIRLGQFKYRFSLEQCTPDPDLELINKSDVVSNLVKPTRDIGVEISKSLSVSFLKTDFAIAVVNGSGSNQSDENDQKTVVARLVLSPLKGLSVGCSVYDGTTDTSSITKDRIGYEIKYEFEKLICKMEYVSGKDDKTNKQGYYATIGYTIIPSVVLLVRYDFWDSNTDIKNNGNSRWSYGLNYFLNKNILLRNNYEQKMEPEHIQNDLFMSELQVKF